MYCLAVVVFCFFGLIFSTAGILLAGAKAADPVNGNNLI